MPEATTPEPTTPEATTPEVATPEATTPELTMPEATTPEPTISSVEEPTSTNAGMQLCLASYWMCVSDSHNYNISFTVLQFQLRLVSVLNCAEWIVST